MRFSPLPNDGSPVAGSRMRNTNAGAGWLSRARVRHVPSDDRSCPFCAQHGFDLVGSLVAVEVIHLRLLWTSATYLSVFRRFVYPVRKACHAFGVPGVTNREYTRRNANALP